MVDVLCYLTWILKDGDDNGKTEFVFWLGDLDFFVFPFLFFFFLLRFFFFDFLCFFFLGNTSFNSVFLIDFDIFDDDKDDLEGVESGSVL